MSNKCAFFLIVAILGLCSCSTTPAAKKTAFLQAGQKHFANKDYPRAILEFKNAVRLGPGDAEPLYQLALAYLAMGDGSSGVANLEKAATVDPKHVPTQIKLAELMATSRKDEIVREAEKKAEEALIISPDNRDALTALAFAEWRLGKRADAEEHLQQVFLQSPQHIRSLIALAKARLARGDSKGAEEALQKAAGVNPPSADTIVALGEFYLLNSKTAQAEQEFRRAVQVDPKYGPALLDLARLQHHVGRINEAEQTFRQLAALPEKPYKPMHAIFLYLIGKQAEAIQEFEALARKEPEDRGVRSRLVSAYVSAKRVGDAETLLAKALAKNPKDVDALLQRSAIYLAVGKFSEATKDINGALQYEPASSLGHYLKSKVHGARKEVQHQKQEIGEALKANPRFLKARIELAQLLIASGAAKAARDLLDEAPEPQNVEFVVQRNWTLLHLNDKVSLQRGIQDGLKLAQVPDLYLQDAMLKFDERKYGVARASIEEVLKRNPEDVRAVELLMGIYIREKRASAGIDKVREHVSKWPKSVALQIFLGRLLYSNGQSAEARKAFLAAQASAPNSMVVELALAERDLREHMFEEARQRLTGVLSTDKTNLPALVLLSQVEEIAGNGHGAMAQYRRILDIDSSNLTALNNLAYHLAEGGKADEALAYAERAKELAPGDAKVDDTIGWVLYKKGVYQRAVRHLEQAVSKEGSARLKSHLALAYLRAGEKKKGREALLAAARLDPNLPEVKEAQHILSKLGADEGRPR